MHSCFCGTSASVDCIHHQEYKLAETEYGQSIIFSFWVNLFLPLTILQILLSTDLYHISLTFFKKKLFHYQSSITSSNPSFVLLFLSFYTWNLQLQDILTDFLHYLRTNHSPHDDRFQYPLIFTTKHIFSLLDLACMYKIWNTSFLPFPCFTYFAVPLDHHRLAELGHRRILARKMYFKTTYYKLPNSPSSQSLEEKNTWEKKSRSDSVVPSKFQKDTNGMKYTDFN